MEQQPNRRPQGQRGHDPALHGETSAQSEPQLLQNLLTKGTKADKSEVDDYMATSFLDKQELAVLRDYQDLLSRLRRLARMIGAEDDFKDSDVYEELVRRMVTIAQTSKSKGGAGFKAVRTEKIVQEENLYQDFAEDEGGETVLERILSKAQEGGGGQQIIGKPQHDYYDVDPSWK